MSSSKTNLSSINYFKGIDLLRFICATGVIFHHSTLILKEKGFDTKAEIIHRYSGAFFLDVFFIISGFLISLILMKEHKQGTFSLKNFYSRRIIRIWPLYFLVVIIKLLIIPLVNNYPIDIIIKNLLYACTFTVNFQLLFDNALTAYTILWSVCIEEHIYLVLPLFLFVFKGKFKTIGWIFVSIGFMSWLYFKGFPSNNGYNVPYFMSFSYFYYFGIGILIAYFHQKNLKLSLLFAPILQIALLIVLLFVVFNIIPHNYSLVKSLLINGLLGGYIVWAAAQENFIIPIKAPIAKYLGNISYGMYMIHIMIVVAIIKYYKKSDIEFSETFFGWGIPTIITIITIVIATIIYYIYERPILKLKRKFTSVVSK